MPALFKLTVLILFALNSGCNEVVHITGTFINSLNNKNEIHGLFFVVCKDLNGRPCQFINITLLSNNDSTMVSDSKLTNTKGVATFSFPDCQVNSINPDSHTLNVIAQHPEIGSHTSSVEISNLIRNEFYVLELNFDVNSESLKKVPPYQYDSYLK